MRTYKAHASIEILYMRTGIFEQPKMVRNTLHTNYLESMLAVSLQINRFMEKYESRIGE